MAPAAIKVLPIAKAKFIATGTRIFPNAVNVSGNMKPRTKVPIKINVYFKFVSRSCNGCLVGGAGLEPAICAYPSAAVGYRTLAHSSSQGFRRLGPLR